MTQSRALGVLLSRWKNVKLLHPTTQPCRRATTALARGCRGGARAGNDWGRQYKFRARNSCSRHNNSAHQATSSPEDETAVGGSQRPAVLPVERRCLYSGRNGYAGICLTAAKFSRRRPFSQTIRETALTRLLCAWHGFCDWRELVGLEDGAFREMAQGMVAAAGLFNHGQHDWLLAYENARKQTLSARIWSERVPAASQRHRVQSCVRFSDLPRCLDIKGRDCEWKRKRGGAPDWESECRRLPVELPTSAANLRNTKRKYFQQMKSELQEESRFARNLVFGASTGF